MTKFGKVLICGVAAAALFGGASVGVSIAASELSPVELAAQRPLFPVAGESKAAAPTEVVPAGAQFRIRSGVKGFRYVACDRQRAWAGGAIEYGCLTFSKAKGWGKSIRWIPKYQLLPVTGDVPPAPQVVSR